MLRLASHAGGLQELHDASNTNSETLKLHILVFVGILEIELLRHINRLLLIIKAQYLTKILEALFAILIEVLNQALLLDDFWHILAESKLSSRVLS